MLIVFVLNVHHSQVFVSAVQPHVTEDMDDEDLDIPSNLVAHSSQDQGSPG